MPLRSFLILSIMVLMIHHGSAGSTLWTFIHDLVQNNIAGIPIIHQKTQWDFDPDLGKQRSVQYQALNGKFGEDAIARLGMGIGYKGPWGKKVDVDVKPKVAETVTI